MPGAAANAPVRPLMFVPKNAIRTSGSDTSVFVVRGQVVEQRAIKTGGEDGDRVEVISGLRSGDRVVAPVPEEAKVSFPGWLFASATNSRTECAREDCGTTNAIVP